MVRYVCQSGTWIPIPRYFFQQLLNATFSSTRIKHSLLWVLWSCFSENRQNKTIIDASLTENPSCNVFVFTLKVSMEPLRGSFSRKSWPQDISAFTIKRAHVFVVSSHGTSLTPLIYWLMTTHLNTQSMPCRKKQQPQIPEKKIA